MQPKENNVIGIIVAMGLVIGVYSFLLIRYEWRKKRLGVCEPMNCCVIVESSEYLLTRNDNKYLAPYEDFIDGLSVTKGE